MSNPHARPRIFANPWAMGLILVFYASARILEAAHCPIPRTALVAFDVLSALVFALVHGSLHYRLRGILVFAAICALVGNLAENLSIATGFPFGRYYFAELMGPKLFQVPILLGLAYIGMAYVSWTLARLIVGNLREQLTGAQIITLPLAASFLMVAWDLAQDPVWATVLHGWVWRDGGPWFGVPVSNYLGWFGTVFTIYQLFAVYLTRRPVPAARAVRPLWRSALLFYALCAAGNLLQAIPGSGPSIVRDPAGMPWRVADITGASALVSIFVMGAFAVLAWIRLVEQENYITS